MCLRQTANSGELHSYSSRSLRWVTQTRNTLQAFIWLTLLSTYCCLRQKSPNNKQSLLLQSDQPALLWVYNAEPQYPTSSTSILSSPWLTWGTRSSWKTAWTPAWTTCLATGLSPSLKTTVRVSSSGSPHSCQSMPCSLQNAKAAQRLHEVDKLAERREMKTQLTAKEKKKKKIFFLSEPAHL